MVNIGDRVGAVQSADQIEVKLFGYGVYEGDKIPESGMFKELHLENPCILLDNGKKVYGYQCWFGTEDEVKKLIGDRKVTIVDPED